MKRCSVVIKNIFLCTIAAAVPLLMLVDGIQARRFSSVESEIRMLEQRQKALIESNKNLITGISMLSSTDRIEKLASEQLGMRLAESDEIIRVEMKSNEGSAR